MDNSLQGEQNHFDGEQYQIMVRDHLEGIVEEYGVSRYRGVDVEVGDYRVEVKGTNSIFREQNGKNYYVSWKTKIEYCPDEVTHFCFVLKDKRINPNPILYFVEIEKIRDYFYRHKALRHKSDWVFFPLHWVLEHYDSNISRI